MRITTLRRHGAATAYTPQSLYKPVTSDWRARGFEFGIVNIPNPAYTNAAHKNGVMSIACIYFDPAFRPGQTCADMIEKDGEGNFPGCRSADRNGRVLRLRRLFLKSGGKPV